MDAHASQWWQYVVVALAVTASAWVVLVKQFPRTARRLRIALATPLVREGRAPWLRRIGRRIAPAGANASACGNCDSCK